MTLVYRLNHTPVPTSLLDILEIIHQVGERVWSMLLSHLWCRRRRSSPLSGRFSDRSSRDGRTTVGDGTGDGASGLTLSGDCLEGGKLLSLGGGFGLNRRGCVGVDVDGLVS